MMNATRAPIRVLLVDDSELIRVGVRTVLERSADPLIEVVGEAGSVESGVQEALKLKPQVVLLDIRMPDGSGFDACRQILAQLPQTRVVILTAHSNDNLVYDAVSSGAHGYLMKEINPAGLVQAVYDVSTGRSILDPEATSRVLSLLRGASSGEPAHGQALSALSAQERRVLALVAEGMTNKQAGQRLGLSENTVKNYLVTVFEKLQVKRRAQAAALYVQQSSPANQPQSGR